ncbi:perlucin-like protein [Hydra vulgaris]|uniref:perlucin-like protein n=1 Tax=Hydra vulgaris TaxID=6087 RepID=UPI0032EA69BD
MENFFGLYIVSMLHILKVSNDCDNGWLEYKTNCYFFQNKTSNGKSWLDASLSCQTLGGHLLSIEDQAENVFVLNIIKDSSMQKNSYWIGLNDACNNREFMWSDNTSPQFFNWLPKRPNNLEPGENCVETNSMGWNDNYCRVTNGFICKFVKENNDSCVDGWLNYKNGCYFFQKTNETFNGSDWKSSHLSCHLKGGNLLSVEDQEENLFITSILLNYSKKDPNYWIGTICFKLLIN